MRTLHRASCRWRLWWEGDYPYVPSRAYGDDDQNFFQHVFYGKRLPDGLPGSKLHPLHPCHNDKGGKNRCDPPERVALCHNA